MENIVDLERYPLDAAQSAGWIRMVVECRRILARDGLFNLPGFFKPDAVAQAVAEVMPPLETAAFTHAREHNIYFKDSVGGLAPHHPALKKSRTVNHTVCADQIPGSLVLRLYEYAGFASFLAAVMGKDRVYAMDDPLARVNVMAYRDGEALNWHFDSAEFTTTLLLQAPEAGGAFEYAKDLRSEVDPNFEGVARLHAGSEPTTIMPLEPGTLNVFRGKNTAHRVTPVKGSTPRIIAVFSFFERPGVVFTGEERRGFYGREA